MELWIILIAIGLITYATRLSFILLFGHISLPKLVQQMLRYVPPTVLSAIIFTELLVREGAVDLSLSNARLLAGLLAALVAWRTNNVLLTIAAGMAALLLIQWIMV
ncbi:MAG: AzlD domain-containing protein [Anaerolineales bacterium]|nr:AzlD domain-containing protein [Anaerolineales bacterium]